MPVGKNEAAELPKDPTHPVRRSVIQGLSWVEDLVYVGLGLLLAIAAVTLLLGAFKRFADAMVSHQLGGQVVAQLDAILLILLFVELLYTVQVSFREHGLIVEPFLVVALIAATRRVLIITSEVSKLPEASPQVFKQTMVELGLLALMIPIFVGSLVALQRQTLKKKQEAAGGKQ